MTPIILTCLPCLVSQCLAKLDSVLGMLRMVADTAPRYESILQLLHGGPIVYGPATGIILCAFSSLADFDRISTNVAILIRATCQSCKAAYQDAVCPPAKLNWGVSGDITDSSWPRSRLAVNPSRKITNKQRTFCYSTPFYATSVF